MTRRRWRAWLWPVVTFVAIAAVPAVAIAVRDSVGSSTTHISLATPPAPAQHVNTRTWRSIAGDVAGHTGDRVVLWGQVTDFDPGGNAGRFLANVDSARHAPRDGTVNYPTRAVLRGEPYLLRPLAKGYVFTAEATVDGAAPAGPDGGLPLLTVTEIRVTDKTVG